MEQQIVNADSNSDYKEQLLQELAECREDARDQMNQVLNVINVASAVLGAILGAALFQEENEKDKTAVTYGVSDTFSGIIDGSIKLKKGIGMLLRSIWSYVTPERMLFFLGCTVFCAAFSYVTVLGIASVLRYHYVQTLEDKATELLLFENTETTEKAKKRNNIFIHWVSFYGVIATYNPKHIRQSRYTLLNYIFYALSITACTLFSVSVLTYLFFRIKPWLPMDIIGVFIFLTIVVFAIVQFFYTTTTSGKATEEATNIATDKWSKRRIKDIINSGAVSNKGNIPKGKTGKVNIKQRILYFIYPKYKDVQKPALIIIGYWMCLFCGAKFHLEQIAQLIQIMFIFDFLLYQARYQYNDIVGIREDAQMQNWRLVQKCEINNNKRVWRLVKLSGTIAILRVVIAAVMIIGLQEQIRRKMCVTVGWLILHFFVYEALRRIKADNAAAISAQISSWLIFFWVGGGYMIRVMVGTVILPDFIIPHDMVTVYILAALWMYGCYAASIPWVWGILRRKDGSNVPNEERKNFYLKKHFQWIFNWLYKHYNLPEEKSQNWPTRNKPIGLWLIIEPWNISYILSRFLLALVAVNIFALDNIWNALLILWTLVWSVAECCINSRTCETSKSEKSLIFKNTLFRILLFVPDLVIVAGLYALSCVKFGLPCVWLILNFLFVLTYVALKYFPRKDNWLLELLVGEDTLKFRK